MNRNFWFLSAAGIVGTALLSCGTPGGPDEISTLEVSSISGTGTLSGEIDAPKPFQAAQVHAMNVDKNILYMVYTAAGRYRAVNMFPGNYEVSVRKKGFAADVQKVVVRAGENTTADFSLREAPETAQGGGYGPRGTAEDVQLVSYDTLYPPGPGRDVAEKTCIYCHGPNFLPRQQRNETGWKAAIDLMTQSGEVRGALIPPGTFSAQDRRTLEAYLTKNFGPTSPNQALKIDAKMPLDEQALARAMYVEYYLPLDPELDADNTQRRGQDPYFDHDGNVWYTDRSIPNRLGRLNPRSGEFKDYVLPEPEADPHGLTVDGEGYVWWAETRGFHLGRLDPRTGEMTRYSMDHTGKSEGARGHTPVTDSKQNVWFTVIHGDRIGKWDRETEKATVWKVPTPAASPYGILVDRNDKVWFAEFRRGKVGKFDPVTEEFTEYPALTQPSSMRRLGMDSKGTVWYGLFSSGKLGKLDPETGEIIEYNIPMPFSEPYDVWPDPEDNVWISDGGQGGTLIKFDPRTEKFTYYPSPQRTDMPKLEITREGAIWYNPRSSPKAAVGVLYPDVTKMTTLAAYY